MDEAHMRAPALIAIDPVRLGRAGRRFPKDLQVHIELAQVSDGLSQFTCANAAIEVDHRRSFAGGTPHWPTSGTIEVLKLCSMMKREGTDIHGFLEPLHKAVLVVEHAFGVTPLDLRQFRVDVPQLLALQMFQVGIFRITANQIEIVAVRNTLRSNKLRKRKNLIEIVSSNYGINIHDES